MALAFTSSYRWEGWGRGDLLKLSWSFSYDGGKLLSLLIDDLFDDLFEDDYIDRLLLEDYLKPSITCFKPR